MAIGGVDLRDLWHPGQAGTPEIRGIPIFSRPGLVV